MENKLQDKAEEIQQECYKTVEFIAANTVDLHYQDATNVYIFRKLAELELRLIQLENEPK